MLTGFAGDRNFEKLLESFIFSKLIEFTRLIIRSSLNKTGFPGSSNGKESACSVRDLGLIPGLEGLLAIIKQMSRQVSRGSAGDYQADEQAGVARLSWRLSSR